MKIILQNKEYGFAEKKRKCAIQKKTPKKHPVIGMPLHQVPANSVTSLCEQVHIKADLINPITHSAQPI